MRPWAWVKVRVLSGRFCGIKPVDGWIFRLWMKKSAIAVMTCGKLNIFAGVTIFIKKAVFMARLYFGRFFLLLFFLCGLTAAKAAEKSKGELGNLVCFVRFQGEEDNSDSFEMAFSDYEALFNGSAPGANSVYNYFREASYGQLSWTSSFFPAPVGDKVVSYQARQERGYYRVKGEINTIGYEDEVDKAAREQALVREVAAYLSEALPDEVRLDADGNGIIDNLCIVVSGRSELGSGHLLWPHRSDLALPDEKSIYIKGKKLVGYLMVFDDANGWNSLDPIPLNTGVLCHEMSHSLGTYDLYHVNDDLNPVGVWDLMSDNLTTPQHMSAYTKWRYCGWLDEIPEISEPGTYTLHPVGGTVKENIAYKIKPVGSEEYFIVEYRQKAGTFDIGLPESGLLVYRINPAYVGGNVNYNGTTRLDEVYVFRPGGTTKTDGNIEQAAFSAESGRTAFGGDAEVKPFYSDGTEARFALRNISACGETMSFELVKLGGQITLSETALAFGGTAGEKAEVRLAADVDWTVEGLPDWLAVSPASGEAGEHTLTVEVLAGNPTAQAREAVLTFASPSDASVSTNLPVRQQSGLILPPSGLSAQTTANGVRLSWVAPQEGAPLVSDGFEDTTNPNGWTIRNAPGERGWTWQEDVRNYEAYEGGYSMYMKSAWEDLHQDEWLISPMFSGGRTLSFYSRSIAPQKNVKAQFYYVEVSTDNGVNWTPVYDLMKDCDVLNQWVKITVDLSGYQSEQMRVAFHAYDENNVGLSYWWQIDNVEILSAPEETMVAGYAVYRDGVKIGETQECTFTDSTATEGEHVYTVRATGAFGETSDSDPLTWLYRPSAVDGVTAAPGIRVALGGRQLTVSSSAAPLCRVRLVSQDGKLAADVRVAGNTCTYDLAGLPRGVYLVVCETEGNSVPQVRKVVLR